MKCAYLGISLGFNSSASVVDKDTSKVIAAISEERLTREKNTKKLPINAIKWVLEQAIDYHVDSLVQLAFYDHKDKVEEYIHKYSPEYTLDSFQEYIQKLLGHRRITFNYVEHHQAHALSVLYFYRRKENEKSLIMTSDGFGLDTSCVIYELNNMSLQEIRRWRMFESTALVYQFITEALGLKPHQHEGKVTGLAAYGRETVYYAELKSIVEKFREQERDLPHEIYFDLKQFTRYKEKIQTWVKSIVTDEDLKDLVKSSKVKNICWAVQHFAEEETLSRLKQIGLNFKNYKLYLAGGLFANVKLNAKFAELGFKEICIAPPMGDEGTCLYANTQTKGTFDNVFSGTEDCKFAPVAKNMINKAKEQGVDIYLQMNALNKYKYQYNDTVRKIAEMLSKGCIIHVRRGRSEFGPRALGHSTTLYQAIDPNGTKTLNKAMGRSEYMPYAPIIKSTNIKDILIGTSQYRHALQYMTVALETTAEARAIYKGAIHVDGTCRAQVIKKSHLETRLMWDILTEYEKLTGYKMLINTSYNIHNYPTVATADDAINTWIESGFIGDGLVLGNDFYEVISREGC